MMNKGGLKMFWAVHGGAPATGRVGFSRPFAGKTPSRAAVHGAKKPATYTLDDKEKVEEEIDKASKEQANRRKEVEEKVDSHLKNSQETVPQSPESLTSS